MMIKTLAVVALCALIGAAAAAAAAGDKPRSSPVAFSYSNCDSSNNKLNSATVSPYPIPTSDGSMVTASGSGTIGTEIDGALLRLTIEKEVRPFQRPIMLVCCLRSEADSLHRFAGLVCAKRRVLWDFLPDSVVLVVNCLHRCVGVGRISPRLPANAKDFC